MSQPIALRQRFAAYALAYPKWSAGWPHIVQEQGSGGASYDVLYATWVLGGNYRNKAGYYGEFPPGLLDRIMALFPDVHRNTTPGAMPMILHAFSGSLPYDPSYLRLDLNPQPTTKTKRPELVGSVYYVAALMKLLHPQGKWPLVLVIADPPYSDADSVKYGTPTVDPKRATRELAAVVKPGRHMCWLDTKWPMFQKRLWRTVGRITVIRSTNHRVRLLTIFERTHAPVISLAKHGASL